MNSLENFNEININLKQNNKLQIELIKRHYKESDVDDNKFADWVAMYGAKFRDLILKKSSENPNFWSDLQNSEFEDLILKELESELKFKEDFKEAA